MGAREQMDHRHSYEDYQNHQHHHEREDDGGESMMMRTYFHFGLGDQLLFKSFTVDSNYRLVTACLVLCLASILNEAIRHCRTIKCNCELRPFKTKLSDHDHDDNTNDRGSIRYCCAANNYDRGEQDNNSSSYDTYGSARIRQQQHCEHFLFRQETQLFKLIQAILAMISYSMSLTLMLVVMTFNICLIFSIIFGSAIGTYLFYRPICRDGGFEKNHCN